LKADARVINQVGGQKIDAMLLGEGGEDRRAKHLRVAGPGEVRLNATVGVVSALRKSVKEFAIAPDGTLVNVEVERQRLEWLSEPGGRSWYGRRNRRPQGLRHFTTKCGELRLPVHRQC